MPDMDLDTRRKRLLWRASHRGIREMDIILGGFAAKRLPAMTARELDELDAIIAIPDQELLAWITGAGSPPDRPATSLLAELLRFRP